MLFTKIKLRKGSLSNHGIASKFFLFNMIHLTSHNRPYEKNLYSAVFYNTRRKNSINITISGFPDGHFRIFSLYSGLVQLFEANQMFYNRIKRVIIRAIR